MIWLVWIFGFFTVLGASQLARRMGQNDSAVNGILIAGFLASVGYTFLGRAGLPDQPFAARVAELEQRDALSLTPGETLARLETLMREQPDDPQPHFFIGEIMRGQGRDQDAVRAYQSALRRDDSYVPAMVALGDALTRLDGGRVGADAKRIYERALVLDPEQVHAGFRVGLADFQAGDTQSAYARWQTLRAGLAGGDPRHQALDALINEAEAKAKRTP